MPTEIWYVIYFLRNTSFWILYRLQNKKDILALGMIILLPPHSIYQMSFSAAFPIKTCILLNRVAEARRLGEQLNEARDRISKLSQEMCK